MKEPTENLNESRGGKRSSSATRRIVVQEPPAQEPPRATGRKLTAAPGSDASGAYDRAPRFSGASASPAHSGRKLSEAAGPTARQSITGPTSRKTLKRSDAKPGQVNVKKLLLISGGMVGFVFLVVVVLLLIPSRRQQRAGAGPAAPATPTAPVASTPAPPSISPVQPVAAASPANDDPPALELAEVKALSERLASQISRKGGYSFSAQFLDLVSAHTHEYTSQRALGAARQYRREINKSFRDEGLEPLIGYALAMSRSKFDANAAEKGIGLWQIPPAVARSQGYLDASENTAKLKSPEDSAQIAAAYTKALLSTFDSEDFMYAIACFGMSLQDAGSLQARMIKVFPDEQSRRDIVKVVNAGVLTGEQFDAVARFFAAGIVGDNPQKFGLADSKPFYSLY